MRQHININLPVEIITDSVIYCGPDEEREVWGYSIYLGITRVDYCSRFKTEQYDRVIEARDAAYKSYYDAGAPVDADRGSS